MATGSKAPSRINMATASKAPSRTNMARESIPPSRTNMAAGSGPPTRNRDEDNRTELIEPVDDDGTQITTVNAPIMDRRGTPRTDIILAHTPGPITTRQGQKPRTVGDLVNPHTPSRINRYHPPGSPGHSVGQVRGLFVPWSREADYGRRDLPFEFPTQRLAPLSQGNQTLATRTITRDFDFYEPPVAEYSKDPLRDRYPYNAYNGHYSRNPLREDEDDYEGHYPYDLPSGHYPYFSYPPDEPRPRYSYTEPIRPPRIIRKPRTHLGHVSDPGKVQTAVWIQNHAAPRNPGAWPFSIQRDEHLNRDFLETPLGKRRYIGHVPRLTDRDRWDRQYDDYLLYNDVDSEVLEQHNRYRRHRRTDPAIMDTSKWLNKNYGTLPDHTDHPNWLQREKEILRQRERERHFGMRRDHLLTRGSLLPMGGSDLGPDWHMSENERLKYLHDQDILRRRDYKDRHRHRLVDNDSDFTSVSQRAAKKERMRLGPWTPLNARSERRYDYKPNWQVNDNWRYKKPQANHQVGNVAHWLSNT
ncbi:uncharacterized protein [Haliotis cracherodii]|uniref:uncharacterized protein n=1 Tax=Haliotis cracherodii TaxID=6455 RepID=UPI0039EA706E